MAEYIKRDSALNEMKEAEIDAIISKKSWGKTWRAALKKIADIPAADVVEVVRCRECRYWIPIYGTSGDCLVRIKVDRSVRVGDFCSYGKRRDG